MRRIFGPLLPHRIRHRAPENPASCPIQDLPKFLEGLGIALSNPVVRASLGELDARGWTAIPEFRLSDEELLEHGLAGTFIRMPVSSAADSLVRRVL